MRFNALWWWIDRWRKSTAYTDMTLEQQGAYRNLIDEANLRGGAIPDEERILAKACGDALAWKRVREAVLARFEKRNDGWHNATLDEVIHQSARRAEKQSRYRRKSGNRNGNSVGNTGGSPDPSPITDPSPPERSQGESARVRGRGMAYAGKLLEVPKFLDEEFVKRLNGHYFDLTSFYETLDKKLTITGEPWDLRWIRDQFAEQSPAPERRRLEREEPDKPITSEERRKAEQVRRSVGCRHEPTCETAPFCVALIVRQWREQEREALSS